MKKAKVIILILTVSMSLLQLKVSSSVSIGVKAGDWAKYHVAVSWYSEDPSAVKPSYVEESEKIEWINVTVKEILGTNVSISLTYYFENETQRTGIHRANMANGTRDPEFEFYLIPARLDEEDRVWQSQLSINSTTSKEFAGAHREVNYASVPITIEGVTVFEYYWDRETGILCASSVLDMESKGGYKTTYWLRIQIIETNMWKAEEQPKEQPQQTGVEWWLLLLIAVIIAVTLPLLHRRYIRKKKIKKRRFKNRSQPFIGLELHLFQKDVSSRIRVHVSKTSC